jgi:hypothetical protein
MFSHRTLSRIGVLAALPCAWCASRSNASPEAPSSLELVAEPSARLRAVAAHGDTAWIASSRGLLVSRDDGVTWRAIRLRASLRRVGFDDLRGGDDPSPRRRRAGLSSRARAASRGLGDAIRRFRSGRRARGRAKARRQAAGHRSWRFVAANDAAVCVASSRRWSCAAPSEGTRFTRKALRPGSRVVGMSAGRGGIALATSAAVRILRPDGRVDTLADVPVADAQRLAVDATGEVLAIATSRELFVARVSDAAGVVRRTPLPSAAREHSSARPSGRRVRGLVVNGRDVYLATRREIWRLDGDTWIPLPRPAEGAGALVLCGARLVVIHPRGAHRLGPLGWQSVLAGEPFADVACWRERLLAVGPAGIFRERPHDDAGALREPRHRSSRRFAWRARWSAWLPELRVAARVARGFDGRDPAADNRWPVLREARRWRHDPVLAVRASSRVEAWLHLRWPLGLAVTDARVHEARRHERHLARLAWRRRRRLRSLVRAVQRGAASLAAAVPGRRGNATHGVAETARRLLRFAEARAMCRALAPVGVCSAEDRRGS